MPTGSELWGTGGMVGGIGSAVGGVLGAWLGYQQLQETRKARREATRQFNLNYDAMRQTTNNDIQRYNQGRSSLYNTLNAERAAVGGGQYAQPSAMGEIAGR